MKRILIVEMNACSGCQSCVIACAMAKAKVFSLSKSRISIWKVESKGLGIPIVCEHCEHPPCQAACPVGAITRDSDTGIVRIASDLCIGCQKCRWVCPFGGAETIKMENNVAVKCDLCNGDPVCAKVCQPGAIVYMPETPSAIYKKWEYAKERMGTLLSLAVRRAM